MRTSNPPFPHCASLSSGVRSRHLLATNHCESAESLRAYSQPLPSCSAFRAPRLLIHAGRAVYSCFHSAGAMFTKMAFPYTGMSLMGFARQHITRTEVWPFAFSGLFALFSLGGLGFGGTPEARAASKYLNPCAHAEVEALCCTARLLSAAAHLPLDCCSQAQALSMRHCNPTNRQNCKHSKHKSGHATTVHRTHR